MRGKWLLFGGITILMAIAGGAISVWRQGAKPKPVAAAPKPIPPPVFSGNEVSLTGKIQAQKVVPVAAPIDGVIDAFFVDVGQDVAEGQLIARIKNVKLDTALEQTTSDLERATTRVSTLEGEIIATRLEASRAAADASRAKAEFERAEKWYTRQKMLFAEGATPRLTYEKADKDYKAAKDDFESKDALARQAEERLQIQNQQLETFRRSLDEKKQALENAKEDVAAGEVHSPVDGTIVSRRGNAGEEIHPSTNDLFSIGVQMAAMEVVIQPPPDVLPRIKAGQKVGIHVAEMNEELQGTVREIKDGSAIIDFISPTTAIKPGLSAQVKITLS